MNIKTFGPIDKRSLEQLERCMQAGDAEYGVLCADHHPGYSQPIGGAVAYEGLRVAVRRGLRHRLYCCRRASSKCRGLHVSD